eukprot:8602127-Alexandrium_andersonii.AAC.1
MQLGRGPKIPTPRAEEPHPTVSEVLSAPADPGWFLGVALCRAVSLAASTVDARCPRKGPET